jgi:hypothetical protein
MAMAVAQQAGKIVEGIGTYQAKRAQAAMLKLAAKQARREGSQEAQLATDEAERAGARAAVAGAGSGGGFEGSFAGVLEDLQRTGVFNARSAIYAGNVEAENRLYEAKVAKQEGTMALISAFVGGGSSIAGDQMRAAEQKKQAAAKRTLYVKGYGR